MALQPQFMRQAAPSRDHYGSVRASVQCLHFDYDALRDATNGFDKRKVNKGGCLLGEGGFGPVFRGKLKVTEVAIKVLRGVNTGDRSAAELATEQFEAELRVLSWYRHPNLVTLMGYSASQGCPRCLIYEFVTNGTLEDALEIGFGGKDKSTDSVVGLPWMARISIALDTARGLSYLHTAVKDKPLVHRDVKSANVLLDLSFRAKVGDFGLARALNEKGQTLFQSQTHRVVGTSGYIAPEYYHGTITTKLDTYAFGVILLEVLTGLPSFDQERKHTDLFTHIDMMKHEQQFAIFSLVDEKAGNWPSRSFERLYAIAEKCLEYRLSARPEITGVYGDLESLEKLSSKLFAEEETMRERKEKKGTSVFPSSVPSIH